MDHSYLSTATLPDTFDVSILSFHMIPSFLSKFDGFNACINLKPSMFYFKKVHMILEYTFCLGYRMFKMVLMCYCCILFFHCTVFFQQRCST